MVAKLLSAIDWARGFAKKIRLEDEQGIRATDKERGKRLFMLPQGRSINQALRGVMLAVSS